MKSSFSGVFEVLKYKWNFRPHATVISKFGETSNIFLFLPWKPEKDMEFTKRIWPLTVINDDGKLLGE